MAPWIEYAALVEEWDDHVGMNPTPETYRDRWQARLRHPSWQEKREFFIWLCKGKCEGCGMAPHPEELQLHHLHYDSLWYESHQDLQLLCPQCHRQADQDRADQQASRHTGLSLEERARGYMEAANRWSGQKDWPVSYREAIEMITRSDQESGRW